MNLTAAYAECDRITRTRAGNFSYGIRLLPPRKRRALVAVYAAARRIDDIGDGDLPAEDKLSALSDMEKALHHLEEPGDDPVMVALADAADRLPIPVAAFDELVDGCRADVTVHRYQTFADLVGYCRCVAGSVGRLTTGVYAPDNVESALRLADSLGIALQLTNILRDLLEDRLVDRIYLPQEDLDAFGCTLQVRDGRLADPPDRLAGLVRYCADRAHGWYDEGLALLPLLDHRSAACTAAMAGIYRRLLERIAADPERVRAQRLSLPTQAKVAVAARALVGRSA